MLQIVLHLSAWLSQQLKLSMQMMMCGTDDGDEGAAAAVLLLYKSKQSSAEQPYYVSRHVSTVPINLVSGQMLSLLSSFQTPCGTLAQD